MVNFYEIVRRNFHVTVCSKLVKVNYGYERSALVVLENITGPKGSPEDRELLIEDRNTEHFDTHFATYITLMSVVDSAYVTLLCRYFQLLAL